MRLMGCICTLYTLLRDDHDVINTSRLRGSKHQSRWTLGLLHEYPWPSSLGLYPFKMDPSEQDGTPITPAPCWGDPHFTLSSAFNHWHHRDVPTFYIISKRPPLPIPLRREVTLLNPYFSLPRRENRPSEVSSNDLISTLSDPAQFSVKPQSEEPAPAHACSPFP